jgi:acyl-CoA thioesterase
MYGSGRESVLNYRPQATIVSLPSEAAAIPWRSSLAPGFTQHYEQRWAVGGLPFSGAGSSKMSVYIRYRGESGSSLTETHALALMDAIPSPSLALLKAPAPASTLSWTLDVLDNSFDFAVDEWWRLDADIDAAAEGYVVHTSHVVNPAGRVAAISRQVVTVYG